jgi:hypothetical protein
MSLSEYSSASFVKDGHARKHVSVRVSKDLDREEPVRLSAVTELRRYFEQRVNLPERDSIVSTIERYLGGERAEAANREVVQASLTRQQRKTARGLGFEVRHHRGAALRV